MRVQRPVLTDFAFQPELLAVGGQQEFNRGGIKTDPVVQGLDLMFCVDAFNRHHRHQNVFLLDQARIAGEQRFDKERFVRHYHVVNPGTGDIHTRQVTFVVDQLVHLRNDDTVMERGGFNQRGRVFSACAGVQIAFAVRFETGNQRHVWREIYVKTGIKFDVGVDSADFEKTVFQQLRNAQALRTGEREIKLVGDALFKDIEMLTAPNAWHNHMQVMDELRVHFSK
ncbi:hypothetical protein D3C78_612180 [compost metagenome]